MNGTLDETLRRIEARMSTPEAKAEFEAIEKERQERREAALASAQRRALEALGLPAKDVSLIRSAALQDTQATLALKDPETLTVLSGGPGCGKTTAAATWLWTQLADRANWQGTSYDATFYGGKMLFITAAKLSRWGRYDDEKMDKLLTCQRLVIDDLGAEYLDEKGAYLSLLDEVINERYANKRLTVLTTNLDAEKFKARYGERIADRVRESGKFVSVGAASMRRKGA